MLSEIHLLDMLLHPSEMDIQLVQVFQQGTERRTLGHLGKGVDILGEALATIAILAVGARYVGVGIIDVAGQQHAGVDLAPVSSHLLAILAASVEVGYLVGSEHVVHILGEFGLQRGHDSEFFPNENFGEQVVGTGEDHSLLLEVLNMGALCQEFRHITHLMASLFGEAVAGTRENSSPNKYRHVRELGDKFFHESQILRTVFFSRHMNL